MTTKQRILISFIFLSTLLQAQKLAGFYKIDDLLHRIALKDTTYVVNFWALWCKPCIQELPAFDSLNSELKGMPVKVLLVNLDFKEDGVTKVNAFLKKNKINTECVLLDEIDGNSYINLISEKWSGAIPATLFKKGNQKMFIEHKLNLAHLKKHVGEIQAN
ncbi:MAG: TlpA disulfide reductase family protein [bacterium]|nr:TlpA disulfide reductase family protein [bacterium]